MKTIVFDIETGALSEQELGGLMPAFDPAEVRLGNMKDPDKIRAKLTEAEQNHRANFMKNAALDALTGRVLAVGLLFENGSFSILGCENEAALLREFWSISRGHRLVGFNSNAFDLPFLIRRSLKHRVEVPADIRSGRFWSNAMVDLRELWQLGDRQARGSLNAIARHLNLGQKTGTGADFAQLWKEDRNRAMQYLRQDVELTARIAEIMGVMALTKEAPRKHVVALSPEESVACPAM